MLTKESFARGMHSINAILSDSVKIESFTDLDVYYKALIDWEDKDFFNGVDLLVKEWKYSAVKPTPGNISDFIRKANPDKFSSLTQEERKVVESVESLINVLPVIDAS